MLELAEHQFEILPSEDASEGVGFGLGLPVSVDQDGFHPGADSWGTQDGENSQRGSTAFGRDRLLGPEWGWDLFTNRSDTVGAVESLASLRTAWRAGKDLRPGEVLPLRYRLAGRDRRIYGRPRGFEAPPTNLILSGMVPITSSFKCVDAFTYDDEPSSTTLSLPVSGQSDGGFIFPVTFPVSTLPPSDIDRAGAVTVGGDEAASPIITFTGPVANPFLIADNGAWRLDLNISLGVGETATVDTRAWVCSAVKNGSQYIGGALGRRQQLSDMRLAPGAHQLTFGGSALDAGATCTVSWRNTHNSI